MRWSAFLLAALAAGGAAADEVMTLQWEAGVIPLSPDDFDAADAGDGTILVRLEPGLAGQFADLSEILIGEAMAILVCGREVARPVIRTRIEGGRLLVPVDDPEAALAVLMGRVPCDG